VANIGIGITLGKQMHRTLIAALIALAGCIQVAAAQEAPQSDADRSAEYANAQEYAACMTLASRKPEDALGSAESWEQRGGGDAAKHCAAVALFGMGKYPDAAERLETLGQSMPADKADLAAQILGQAGLAWQNAGAYDRALAAQTAALKLAPDDVALLVDRSTTQFFLGKCWEAIDDLNEANERAPDRPDILVLRASAYRCVESLELARGDVERALELKPGDPEALLERGTLRHLGGDEDGARADWLQVAKDAGGTPAADAAQMNLERLDLKAQ
jgi:tetratricopeptide (TPR) repeat protein